jgi:hypothetical protein
VKCIAKFEMQFCVGKISRIVVGGGGEGERHFAVYWHSNRNGSDRE